MTKPSGPTKSDPSWDRKRGKVLRHTFSMSCDMKTEAKLAEGDEMARNHPLMKYKGLVDIRGEKQAKFESDRDLVVAGKVVMKKGSSLTLTKDEVRENVLNMTGEMMQIETAAKSQGASNSQVANSPYFKQVTQQKTEFWDAATDIDMDLGQKQGIAGFTPYLTQLQADTGKMTQKLPSAFDLNCKDPAIVP